MEKLIITWLAPTQQEKGGNRIAIPVYPLILENANMEDAKGTMIRCLL